MALASFEDGKGREIVRGSGWLVACVRGLVEDSIEMPHSSVNYSETHDLSRRLHSCGTRSRSYWDDRTMVAIAFKLI